MKRADALLYVCFAVDDAMAQRDANDVPDHARLIGWQCGFEPLFVAVWSYLPDVRLDDDDAAALATDFLIERGWFVDPDRIYPDYII